MYVFICFWKKYYSTLKQKVNKLELQDYVIWLGYIKYEDIAILQCFRCGNIDTK